MHSDFLDYHQLSARLEKYGKTEKMSSFRKEKERKKKDKEVEDILC